MFIYTQCVRRVLVRRRRFGVALARDSLLLGNCTCDLATRSSDHCVGDKHSARVARCKYSFGRANLARGDVQAYYESNGQKG
jgi:hypothetical protein